MQIRMRLMVVESINGDSESEPRSSASQCWIECNLGSQQELGEDIA